jgi:hypothetical protein
MQECITPKGNKKNNKKQTRYDMRGMRREDVTDLRSFLLQRK